MSSADPSGGSGEDIIGGQDGAVREDPIQPTEGPRIPRASPRPRPEPVSASATQDAAVPPAIAQGVAPHQDERPSLRVHVAWSLVAIAVAGAVIVLWTLSLREPRAGECGLTLVGVMALTVASALLAAFLCGAVFAAADAPSTSYLTLVAALSIAAGVSFQMVAATFGCRGESAGFAGVAGLVAASIGLALGYVVGRVARRVGRAIRGR